MEEKKSNIGKIVLFIIAIIVIYRLATKNSKWSYMVCSEIMDDQISCQQFHLVRLDDCNSKEECYKKANDYLKIHTQYKSFEVGQGCRWDEDWGTIVICKLLCDKYGDCHK